MKSVMLYITTGTMEEAQRIGAALLEKRMVACVNIMGGMQSMFWWQGRVESSEECIMLAKTTESRVDECTALIKQHHTYECPCVVQLSIDGGNAAFLKWVQRETEPIS